MKTKEAEETTIYVVESLNEKYQKNLMGLKNGQWTTFHNEADKGNYEKVMYMSSTLISCDYRVKKTNLLDFVMISASQTTSPIGVSNILFTRENEENETVEVREWVGSNSILVDSFDNQEDADEYIFDHVYNYDFCSDDQRDTRFYYNEDEATKQVVEAYAEMFGVDSHVAESIYTHFLKLEQLKAKRDRVWRENEEIRKQAEKEQIEKEIAEYGNLIQPEYESFKQTAARLSSALNGKIINSKAFYAIVNLTRSNFNK